MEVFFYGTHVILTLFTFYYFVVSLFGFFRRNENYSLPPGSRFAVVVAAHNEERVIGELIRNLQGLDYPKELYHIYVVADNCTDNTAAIAARKGARVIERFNNMEKGKGYALEYAFNNIFESGFEYDAVVVFDADNLVSTDFLTIMNSRLLRGEKIIQGYLDTKNADDTWITKSIYIGYLLTNRFWQLAKYNMGFTCALGGTGMCLSTAVLKQYGWGMTSLTEDLEFQTKALMNNIKVNWAHDARVYDEKPLNLPQSWRQRRRWMQGHCNVAGRYLGKLLLEGIRTRNFAMIDGAVYLIQPFLLMFTGMGILLNVLMGPELLLMIGNPVWIVIGFCAQFFYFGLGLTLERVKLKVYWWLLFYPIFAVTWIPVAYVGFAMRKNKNWDHTFHFRNIKHENLKNLYLPAKANGRRTS
ncbi:MAG: Glycosyltransferase [Pelotomaculum thermopropionicum]|uniref:Glycosyltransferase n=1 Tax=Pelotomaculum thermopropionicum TaxID=110500 RepID=A0A101HU80_9FIRM|nr:MAG: Glycosyltransferase [Pelotomaculum thermopropionicum]